MKSPCAHCGKPANQVCQGCDLEVYCNERCQNQHWSEHRETCDNKAASVDVRFGRSKNMSLTTYLELKRDFSTLFGLIEEAGLQSALNQLDGVTLLAPDNKAFEFFLEKIDQTKLTPDAKQKILLYHALAGKNTKAIITNLVKSGSEEVDTALTKPQSDEKETVRISYNERRKEIRVNDALVTRPDILVKNGIIHRIDTVLVPPDLRADLFRK